MFLRLTLALAAGWAGASPALPAMKVSLERPDPAGAPTLVRIGAYLVNVANFNEQEQTFSGDFIVNWSWLDPRLRDAAAKGPRVVPLGDIWNPRLLVVNRRNAEFLYPSVAEVDPTGAVRAVQRLNGSASIPVRLRDFPFDKQSFFLEVVTRGYGPDEVKLVVDPRVTGREKEFSLSGWRMKTMELIPFEKTLVNGEGSNRMVLSGIRIQIEGARDWQYYALREILPLAFIVLMASALFWLPAKEHGLKIGISTAAIFSLMAYYVQLGRSMPRLDYLTRMDRFIVGSTILVFVSFAQVIAGMYLVGKQRENEVVRMESWSRAIYPVLLGAIVWFSFKG